MWDRIGVLLRKGYRFGYVVGGRFTIIMYFVYLLRFTKYLEVLAIPGIAARISDPHSVITIKNDKVVGLDIHRGSELVGLLKSQMDMMDYLFFVRVARLQNLVIG